MRSTLPLKSRGPCVWEWRPVAKKVETAARTSPRRRSCGVLSGPSTMAAQEVSIEERPQPHVLAVRTLEHTGDAAVPDRVLRAVDHAHVIGRGQGRQRARGHVDRARAGCRVTVRMV